MSQVHKGNTQPAISQEEHEHSLEPATKRVLMYGYDGSAKQILKTDSSGKLETTTSVSASTVDIGSAPTIYAVVNTTAAVGTETVTLYSTPTLYAVVNTSAVGQASVVIDTGANWIGLTTAAIASAPTLYAVVNTAAAGQASVVLDAGANYIGLATVDIGSAPDLDINDISKGTQTNDVKVTLDSEAVVLDTGTSFIGLTTSVIGSAPTLYAVVNTENAVTVSATDLDIRDLTSASDSVSAVITTGTDFIGLATTVIGSAPTLYAVVNVPSTIAATQSGTWNIGEVTTLPDVDINDISKGTQTNDLKVTLDSEAVVLDTGTAFVGLTTSVIGSAPTLFAVVNTAAADSMDVTSDSGVTVYQGDASWTVEGTVTANLAAGNNNIGDVDVASIAAGDNNIGNVDIVTLPSLVAGSAYVGLATVTVGASLPAGTNFVGLATVVVGSALPASSNYIGLATVVPAVPTAVVHGFVSAASGGTTQFAANTIKWVSVKSMPGNATTAFLGINGVTASTGLPIEPGETHAFTISNTNLLYVYNGYGTLDLRYLGA